MKVTFFGDSFTSGEGNDNFSFVEQLPFIVRNYGVSGTTIGEYSIYPVDGNSLLSVIPRHSDQIKNSDIICLEYGINDTTAIMCGFTTLQRVIISFVKALDCIRQINPRCKIVFLSLSNNDIIIKDYAELQCSYLECEYFKDYDFNMPETFWADTYISLIEAINKSCEVIPMITYENFFDEYLSDDKVHPNGKGYERIARVVEGNLL